MQGKSIHTSTDHAPRTQDVTERAELYLASPVKSVNMEEVKIIDPLTDPRWDAFVAGHPYGWIVHTSGWKKVIESTFPHMKGHYFALVDSDTNNIKAGLPIYEIRSWLTGNRLVSIPFATLSDPLVLSDEQFKILVEKVIIFARKRSIKTINIRFFRANQTTLDSIEYFSCFNKTHQLTLSHDSEEIRKKFNRNIRRIIKTFENNELTLRVANTPEDIFKFHQLYSKTRKRLGLPTQPYELLKNLFACYAPLKQISLYIAQKGNLPIGGLIVFKYKDRVSSEFLASEIEHRHLNTDHFLYWNAIRIACEEGYPLYDFGRTAISNESLADFKRRWGTTELELPEYYNPKNQPREKRHAYRLIQKACKHSPYPCFQSLSNFCYRHLG